MKADYRRFTITIILKVKKYHTYWFGLERKSKTFAFNIVQGTQSETVTVVGGRQTEQIDR